jgi:fatty acid desaturase
MYDPKHAAAKPGASRPVRLIQPRAVFSADEIARLRRRSNLCGVGLVLHAWGTVALAMGLCVAWLPLSFLAAIIVIGGRQLGLAILMHDAAHGLLLTDRRTNDRVGAWLCGFPVLADLATYRSYHLSHHRLVQSPDDPDLVLSAPFPATRASFRRKVLRDLTGQTAYRQRLDLVRGALGSTTDPLRARLRRAWGKLRGPIVANLVLLGVLTALGPWWLYPLLWLLPLATVYQLASRVRNIAEHAMVPDNDDAFRNARTTYAGWLARAVFAPYWVNFHLEHHLAMFIPCYRLPEAHRMLLAKGYGARMEIKPGYGAVLEAATSRA